jgi:hypothetical protein
MGNKPVKGTRQINVELDETLLNEVKKFVEARGQTLRHFAERAFRRHLDNPPPLLPDPPLPPCEPEPTKPAPKRRSKRA